MTRFTTYQQQTIERIVTPERARFDLPTRQEFSRDAGVQPRLGPLNGRTLADAVVWPADERELVELVEFTSSSGVALVPRGGGTAGYGGGVPVDGGVVLDLTRLCGLVSVDPGRRCGYRPRRNPVDHPGNRTAEARRGAAPLSQQRFVCNRRRLAGPGRGWSWQSRLRLDRR
jgi:FAD binding domain